MHTDLPACLPPPADIQWVCMTGYADPAHTDVARAYAERLRARLAPFSTPTTSGYINMVDMAEGEAVCSVF